MHKLKFSNYIYEDVESSINYINNVLENPIAAKKLYEEIKKMYKKIKINPFIYPKVPVDHLAIKGFRFTMVKNYMLFFKVKEKEINVERFLYGPRDWISILENTN